jgi:hypothetical protein
MSIKRLNHGVFSLDSLVPFFDPANNVDRQATLEEMREALGEFGGSLQVTEAVDGSGRIDSLTNLPSGAAVQFRQTLAFDINYWLTEAEIADTQRQNGPTINLTAKIQGVMDALVARWVGPPNPATKSASMAIRLRFHHSYLVDGLSWHPAIVIEGDSMRDTIFVQSDTPNGHLLRALARNGQVVGLRISYHQIRDVQLLGSNKLGPGNMVTRGMHLDDSDTDPVTGPGGEVLGHAAVLAERVSSSNFSGAGTYLPKKRHGPKHRFCYWQGSGKQLQINGIATLNGTGQYEPNVYDNSDSDSEYTSCGNGGGAGDSYFIQNGETCQMNGGDCWASQNPELGYVAIRATGMDYLKILGLDINGKCYFKGNGSSASSQIRFIANNMRFRKSSFGTDDDTGQPAPLDAYLEFEDVVGASLVGNTFTPYYDPHTGIVAARPSFIYKATGATKICPMDRLPAIDSNDWPAGANIAVAPTLDTVTNNWLKIAPVLPIIATDNRDYLLTRYLRFVPGTPGGLFGRTDGLSVPAGMVGEMSVVPSSGAVGITSATNTNLTSVALTAGVYKISGSMQAQVASGSPNVALTRFGIGTISGNITTTTSASFAERQLNATAVGSYDRLDLNSIPLVVAAGATVTVYAVGRINFTGGTMAALGHLTVERVG